jgi:hypothetical protein
MYKDKFLKYINEKKIYLKEYRSECILNDRYDIMAKVDSNLNLLKEIRIEYKKIKNERQ